MKQLVATIKIQIQQIKNLSLRDWLLSHLNEDANNLKELFGKQLPAHPKQGLVSASFSHGFPPNVAILSIFYTYAAESLRKELADKLLARPEFMDEDKSIIDEKLNRELSERLIEYRMAWPIIAALQKQGAYDLIQILDSADEQALKAFARLTRGGDLTILVDTFLVKNSNDLDLVDRRRLIEFLRQPDLATWFTKYLEALVCQSTNVMSLKLLMLIFTPFINEQDRITELRAYLANYRLSIHLETIRALINFYSHELEKIPYSPLSNAVIFLLHDLMRRIDLTAQNELVNGLNQECLFLILEQCLKGCSSSDLKYQQVCKDLLFMYCSESVVSNKAYLDLIKTRLQHPDPYLFDTPELFGLITGGINSPEHAFGGSWISRLLIAPQFIALSSDKILKHLIDRYRLLSTTLNQVEYIDLLLTFKEQILDYQEVQTSIIRINQNIVNYPETRGYWLDKRNRLLEFCSDRMVHALLMQLEDFCEQQKSSDPVTSEMAIAILYTHYSQTLPSLRTDLLLRAADFAYRSVMNDKEDIDDGRSILLAWFKQYTPQNQLVPTKLQRKKEVKLYNSVGQKIGFLNEANLAMAFVEYEPILLGKTGLVQVDEPLYDEQGYVMGYLTASGQIRSVDLFQNNASAQLLALVPIKDLEQSPYGLGLLVKNVLLEDTLEGLYAGEYAEVDCTKRVWLEQRFSFAIRDADHELSSTIINCLVNNHSDEEVFSLLQRMKNRANAVSLFFGILNHDKKREVLFSSLYNLDLRLFLDRHDAVRCLADYMAHYFDKSWFAEGLMFFASFSKLQKKDGLLGEALTLLSNEVVQSEQPRAFIDSVLERLLGSEACARVVLQEFLNDRTQRAVQELHSVEINKVTQYVHKRHLLAALQTLNKISHWESSSLYKLVLHIFEAQHYHLFPSKEFIFAAKQSWQSNELAILAEFFIRHLSKKRSMDSDFSLGYRVLGELIFRCANAGQISLFYKKKSFNPTIARLSFTRPFLERLVDKFWIPEGVKEQFVNTVMRIRSLFDEQSFLQKELGSNRVLMDWRHLINQTWKEINKKKLPIICAYLLNYSGPKKPLIFLLGDYFNTFQNEVDYLYPVVKLLKQFPQRDVSAVIFDALEMTVIKYPHLLDKTMLHHMAHYYAKKIVNQELRSPQAELNLLIYFGQNKYYPLVQKGCEELAQGCSDKKLKKRLLKGVDEAKVESDLSSSLGRFYFGCIKVFKRLWHYGLNVEKNASGIVRFCDDASLISSRQQAVDQVKTPVGGGKVGNDYLEFSEKRKQLIRLLATIKHSPVSISLSGSPSSSTQTLFNEGLKTKLLAQETVVAAENAVVSI